MEKYRAHETCKFTRTRLPVEPNLELFEMRPGVARNSSKLHITKYYQKLFKLIINSPRPSYSLQYSLCSYTSCLSSCLNSCNSHTNTDHAQDLRTTTESDRTVRILYLLANRQEVIPCWGENEKKLLWFLLKQEAKGSLKPGSKRFTLFTCQRTGL